MQATQTDQEASQKQWLEDCTAKEASPLLKAIRQFPTYLVTPSLIADIAAATAGLCNHLPTEPKEIAQNYLDDLHEDMKGCS